MYRTRSDDAEEMTRLRLSMEKDNRRIAVEYGNGCEGNEGEMVCKKQVIIERKNKKRVETFTCEGGCGYGYDVSIISIFLENLSAIYGEEEDFFLKIWYHYNQKIYIVRCVYRRGLYLLHY